MNTHHARWLSLFAIILLLPAGCQPVEAVEPMAEVQLTPYLTRTPQESAATPEALPTETPSPTPDATPAPLVHEVALQETISSIAERYGVPTAAILEANPDVDPRALTVGTQLLIPMDQATRPQSAGNSESLVLDLRDARCEATAEGGLWCHALLTNPLSQTTDRLLVRFTLSIADSQDVLRVNVPALLNRIQPGETVPVSAFIPAPAPRVSGVTAELLSALPVSENTTAYLDAALQNERINLQGRLANVTVEVLLPSDALLTAAAAPEIWLVASAYDNQGRLLGARRLEHTPEDPKQNPVELTLQVFSNSAQIERVRLQVEAFFPN